MIEQTMSQGQKEQLESDKLVNLWLYYVSINVCDFALNEIKNNPICHHREKQQINLSRNFLKSQIKKGMSGKGELGDLVKSQSFDNVSLLTETFVSLAMMPPSEVDTLCEKIINLCQEVADKKSKKNDE